MTVFTFPQNIYPFDAQISVVGATDTFVARPGTTQTQTRDGSHWTYRVDFRNMSDDQWDELEGFIAKINGREHRIRTPMWHRRRIRGDIKSNSAALVAGRVNDMVRKEYDASLPTPPITVDELMNFRHRGTKLGTAGWGDAPADGAKLFRVGDLIEIRYPNRSLLSTQEFTPMEVTNDNLFLESRLHRITEDVDWEDPVLLDIWPPITVDPTDGAKIIVLHPHETWIMTSDPSFSEMASLERKTSILLATDLLTGLRI